MRRMFRARAILPSYKPHPLVGGAVDEQCYKDALVNLRSVLNSELEAIEEDRLDPHLPIRQFCMKVLQYNRILSEYWYRDQKKQIDLLSMIRCHDPSKFFQNRDYFASR